MAETIQEPGVLERLATNVAMLTGAVSTLIAQLGGQYGAPGTAPTAEPAKVTKPRGRQAKGEENGVAVAPSTTPAMAPAVSSPATSAVAEVDPFEIEQKPAAKPLELTDVRAALIAYQKTTSPEAARKKLKEHGGVDSLASLTADKFQAVVDSLK